jgi:hypothetical protein
VLGGSLVLFLGAAASGSIMVAHLSADVRAVSDTTAEA